jgi:DNA-binding transcriptional LysR family regulator
MEGADLRRAAVFHAVARAGGISAAARAIGKSPPAVHAELRRFERDIGVVLMERSGRALRLTPKGRKMYETVDRALAEISKVRAHLSNATMADVPLRIGAVTAFGRYRIMPALAALLHADRQLVFRTGSHEHLLAALMDGQIDLAVTYRPVTAVQIESEKVAVENLVLAGTGPETFPSLSDLQQLRFITYEEHDYVFGQWFAHVFGRQPHSLIRHDHFEELEEALVSVRAGRGMTIAPLDACLALGLGRLWQQSPNALYICGVGDALFSNDAVMIKQCLTVADQGSTA